MNRIALGATVKPLWSALETVTNAFDKRQEGKKPWRIVAETVAVIAGFIILMRIAKIEWKPKIATIALWWKSKEIEQKREENRFKMEEELFKEMEYEQYETMPPEGISKEELLESLRRADHSRWQNGKATGAVYHNRQEIKEIVMSAINEYYAANPLHPELFPDVRKHEAGIIRMTLNLFNGNQEACGSTTSGGTESIILACLAARERSKRGNKIHRVEGQPEIIVPTSAHAAFKKAAFYLGMKLVVVPVNPVTLKADVKAMEKAITKNTVLMVASCCGFPHGMVDPVEDLSLAVDKYNGRIGLHVDCCMGSYLVPFLPNLAPFDFRVKNVTSISCDPHKYGYGPKGGSVIMYRDQEWLRHQYFVDPTWSGGVYGTPTLAGSRPGALIAATWAVMQFMGIDGYRKEAAAIYTKTQELYRSLLQDPDIEVLGIPQVSVLAFSLKDKKFNVYELKEKMKKKGWYISELQHPPALHFCLTLMHADNPEFTKTYMQDLKACIEELKKESLLTQAKKKEGKAALYGTMHSIPNVVGWLRDYIFGVFVQDYFLIMSQTRPRLWKKAEAPKQE